MDEAVAVIGAGAWGTALAAHQARLGRRVRLWAFEPDLVQRMRREGQNPLYLPGVSLPEGLEPCGELARALDGCRLVVAAVPSAYARAVYRRMAPWWSSDRLLVLATKGIEIDSLALPAEVAEQELASAECAVLSGPCFAREVARGLPTAAVVAAASAATAERVQALLSGENLRLYSNTDPVGVQLGGALKNVIAIAAGVVDGIGFGYNTLAALMTRGLAEMTRLAAARGGDPATLSGLAGLGDLVATCAGSLSRNRTLGQALGRGDSLELALRRSEGVAEGVWTTRAAHDLARETGVEMPIVREMYRILYGDGTPQDAVARLMSRPLTAENGGTAG